MSTSTPRPTERRTLHFDLSHTRPGAEHTLHAGGRRHVLKPHTDTTRGRHRAALRVLAVVPDERLTHYLEEVDFPETAVQSFYVTHPHAQPNGLPRLSLMAINVPQQALQRLTLPGHQAGALYVAKAKRLGLDGGPAGPRPAEPMDLADYVDMTEAAKLIDFHHPELISLDPHTAATTLAYIENAPSFPALVRSLNDQGQGQRPGGDYEGWANGKYLLDKQGNKIPDGKGGYRWKYAYTAETRNFMRPVVQQALLRVRDDPHMEGIGFATHFGTHNVRNAPSPRPVLAAAVHAAARREPTPYAYKLDDTDWRAGRQVVITEVTERDLTITVNNSYFRDLDLRRQRHRLSLDRVRHPELRPQSTIAAWPRRSDRIYDCQDITEKLPLRDPFQGCRPALVRRLWLVGTRLRQAGRVRQGRHQRPVPAIVAACGRGMPGFGSVLKLAQKSATLARTSA